MIRRLALAFALPLLLAAQGCSWPWDQLEPRTDGPGDLSRPESLLDRARRDSPADVSSDRAHDVGAVTCNFTGSWRFDSVERLPDSINTAKPELEPYLWFEQGTVHLYFSRGDLANREIWQADGNGGGETAFANARAYDIGPAARFSVTVDGLTAFVSARKGYPNTGTDDFDLFSATRTSVTAPFAPAQFSTLAISTSGQDWDAYPSADGLELFYSISDAGASRVFVARRGSTSVPFAASSEVTATAGGKGANPAITSDGRVLFFSSNRSGSTSSRHDLWYVVRDNGGEFSGAQLVPGVNSEYDETESYITPDGCWLYFASTRDGDHNQADIYRARYKTAQ